MRALLHKTWTEFKEGQPGRRFQDRYERKRNAATPWYKSVFEWLLAMVCILVGIVLAFIPGPAILFFALAALFLADQSRTVARSLDWLEIKLRRLFGVKSRAD
jgi:multidrug efflux pump subunit AcrB